MKKKEKNINLEAIKHSSLFNPAFLMCKENKSLELANLLVKPVMDYLKKENYQIQESMIDIFEDKKQICLDLKLTAKNSRDMIVSIYIIDSDEFKLRELTNITQQYEADVFQEEDLAEVPELILICYSLNPLEGLDDNEPVGVLQYKNLLTNQYLENSSLIFLINSKYQNPEFKSFTKVIEELESRDIQK